MRHITYRLFLLMTYSFLCIALLSCRDDGGDEVCAVGSPCDDFLSFTENDSFNNDCECTGTLICTIGGACDDGNPITENDTYDGECNCVGTECVAGNPCDDGDNGTYYDLTTAECGCEGIPYTGTYTDSRDGQVYQTILINDQEWMAENMNYDMGNNLCYDDVEANCDTYGKLYTFETAAAACPMGWHLPTDEEWTALTDYLGGETEAGGKMKITGQEFWASPNGGATNESGFTALGVGAASASGNFLPLGFTTHFWSSTDNPDNNEQAFMRVLDHNGPDVFLVVTNKTTYNCVRCMKD